MNRHKNSKKMRKSFWLGMILFLTAIFCIPAEAAETSSLTLYFNPEGAVFHLYRTADLEADGSYTFSGQFADCPAELPGYDWLETAVEVAAYAADKQPDAQQEISGGSLTFSDLSEGLYLVTGNPIISQGIRYTPVPFLMRVENGNVISYVKSDQEPVEEPVIDYQVKKVWKNDGAKDRPDSVSVYLLKDDAVVQTVTLSAENQWSYSWTDTGEHTWQVREIEVPGYTTNIAQNGNQFIITNTLISSSDPSEVPGTGDNAPLWLAMLFCGVSALGILVVKGKKQNFKA